MASSGGLDGILTCCGFFSCAFFGSPASLAFSFWVVAVVLAAGAGGATTGTGCWLVVLRCCCAKRTGGWPALLVVGAGGTTLQSNVVPPLDNVGITIPFQALQRASACDPAWQYRKAEQSLPGKYLPARHNQPFLLQVIDLAALCATVNSSHSIAKECKQQRSPPLPKQQHSRF